LAQLSREGVQRVSHGSGQAPLPAVPFSFTKLEPVFASEGDVRIFDVASNGDDTLLRERDRPRELRVDGGQVARSSGKEEHLACVGQANGLGRQVPVVDKANEVPHAPVGIAQQITHTRGESRNKSRNK